jgi:hypothetical protein
VLLIGSTFLTCTADQPGAGASTIGVAAGGPSASCPPAWNIAPTPAHNGADGKLDFEGVSSLGSGDIWTVGYSLPGIATQPLAEHFDGSTWTVMSPPSPSSGDTELESVDDISTDDVWAVGYTLNRGGPKTLVENWNGSTWSVVASPSPGSGDNLLESVTSMSTDDVWAVGYTTAVSGGIRQTLVEHWDGASWSIVPSANSGSGDNVLLSVSAGAPGGGLWAVGYTMLQGSTSALIEYWNGSTWSIVTGGDAGDANGVLTRVAVAPSGSAWAVGYVSGAQDPESLVEVWDGTSWAETAVPQPGTGISALLSVTAASATNVTAVGTYYEGGSQNYAGYSEHWDGTQWAESPLAVPSNANHEEIRDVVAVPGSTQTWAVGAAPIGKSLAEYQCFGGASLDASASLRASADGVPAAVPPPAPSSGQVAPTGGVPPAEPRAAPVATGWWHPHHLAAGDESLTWCRSPFGGAHVGWQRGRDAHGGGRRTERRDRRVDHHLRCGRGRLPW